MDRAASAHEDALDSRPGWVVVALGFLVLGVLWGAVFTFTVYADDLAAAFDLTGLQTSAVFSVTTAAFFVVGGTVGVLVARVPLRPVVGAAALSVAASAGLLQVVDGVAVAMALMGVAGGTMFVLTVSVVPQWFDRYQGTAMGLTVAGNGLGVQVFPYAWLWLLARTSMRRAFLAVGALGVLVLLAAALAYRRPPGLRGGGAVAVDWAWLRALFATRRYLAAFAGLTLSWGWYFILSSGMVEILTTAGIGRAVAATAFGLVGGVSVVSRVGAGGLADWIGSRRSYAVGSTLAAVGLFVLSVTATVPVMYVSLVAFGVGLGAIAALYPAIVVRAFGPENATAITGSFMFCSAVSGFLTPVGMDAMVGATGGFALPLVAVGVLTAIGTVLFYWGTDPAA